MLDKYLDEERCSVVKDRITCENSLNIDKMDNVTLTLTLNGI